MADTTRRRFLQYGAPAGAMLVMPAARRGVAAISGASQPRLAGGLRKFREPLPVPGRGIVVATSTKATYTHCHIVEHEDNEMMRPFTVLP